jgi:hypothetical protein
MYCCFTAWTLWAVGQKHLESFEMWCCRRMEKVSWTDHVRNEDVLDDLKERRGYSHLKVEALDRTMWRACFRRGFGPVIRQTTK